MMRYQYMSMAHFLARERYPDPYVGDSPTSVSIEHGWGGQGDVGWKASRVRGREVD